MKAPQLSQDAILATQRIRMLLDGPSDPKLATRMAEIIDEEISRKPREPLERDNAALRAHCERLEGALRQTIDRCARVELGAPSYHLANDLANVLRATLAQPEDDESIREDMEQFVSEGPENEGDK